MTKKGAVNSEKNENSKIQVQSVPEVVDFDTILAEEVGKFGWFQIQNVLLALIAIVFLTWNNNSYVFTAAKISTRCHIGECDFDEPEFAPDWLLNAIPGTSLNSFDNCRKLGNATQAKLEGGSEDTCPAVWFDQNQTQSCDRYLYKDTDTIVYDFNLACDEWRRSLIGTFRLFGTMFAQTISGYISDRWGRRTALIFNAFNSGWMGVLKSYSTNYYMFVAADFLSSIFGSATFQSAYILVMELVGSERRVIAGAWMNTCKSVGLMSLGLIAWAVPYWRDLTRATSIPPLFTITYIWLMTESIRWYISKGRYDDTEKALKKIAKVNKKLISEKSLENLRNKAQELKMKQEESLLSKIKQDKSEPSLMKLLFQHKPVLIRCFITPFMWITFTLIYQGLTINAVDISGNKYVNYIAVAAAQIPGFWISEFILDKIGRKAVLIGSYWICAACQIAFIFVSKEKYVLSLAIYMIGACCSGGILSVVYIYTAELYPTKYRHRLFGFSSTMGRFGSVLATLTPALGTLMWEFFPFALFAGCACVAGALVLLLPETRGMRLPATMQEAADLGKKKREATTA